MDGSWKRRKLRESRVRRTFEWNRLEDAVWAMAYEQVWPIVRRTVRSAQTESSGVAEGGTERTVPVAAGA